MFVFGSGLAVVPFLYGGVVHEHHWLTDQQFVDAVAVAMITPGPVVITVAFIGYLIGGFWGATVAALGMFIPVYLIVVVLAPSYKRWAKNPQLSAFVQGVTAAATGEARTARCRAHHIAAGRRPPHREYSQSSPPVSRTGVTGERASVFCPPACPF